MIKINQQFTYTSKQNIGQHIASILEDNELDQNSVIKNYFTTATNGKANYAEFATIKKNKNYGKK